MVQTSIETFCTIEIFRYKNMTFHSWDIDVHAQRLWQSRKQLHASANAIIWMMDSSKSENHRDAEGCTYLAQILTDFPSIPCLILANKQDLPNARGAFTIANVFGVRPLKNIILNEVTTKVAEHLNNNNRPWRIQPCSVILSDGVYEGFDWLFKVLSAQN